MPVFLQPAPGNGDRCGVLSAPSRLSVQRESYKEQTMGNLNFTGPYMPPGDKDFYDWLENAAALLKEDPGRYGLGESDAKVIENLWCSY
jgi:hypothetical protein